MRRPPESPAPQNFARGDGVDTGRFPRRHWPLTLGLALGLALVGWAAWELRPGRDPAPPPDGDALRQPASAPSAPSTDPVAIPPAASEGAGIIVGEELDNEPPATVDSPEARRAWLERIRELRDSGDRAAAQASLLEYRRRYPTLELPDDLQGLLPE